MKSLLEPATRLLIWIVAASVMIAALLWPALWNGFPILSDDTGGYLGRPFEGTLLFGRSAFYGAFLALGIPLNFWPNLVAQAALLAWLIVLGLRTHGFGGRPWLAAATVICLSGLTSLAWFASQLMPDTLVPVAVFSLYLVAFRAPMLKRWEKIVLGAAIMAAMASHMSIVGLAVALIVVLVLLRPYFAKLRLPQPNLLPAALAVLLGVALGPLSNLGIAGRLEFTPGGANFVLARLIESGIVERYLSDQCPDDPTIQLCAFRGHLPPTGDEWLWEASSPLFKLGGSDKFGPEAQRIVLTSLQLYPGQSLAAAFVSAAQQFFNVGLGYTTKLWHWHASWTLERLAPNAVESFFRSRQGKSQSDLSWLSMIHVPVAWVAITSLLLFVMPVGRHRIQPAVAALSAVILAALLSNAAICGSFAVPADRFQNRLVPLAPFAAGLAALSRRR